MDRVLISVAVQLLLVWASAVFAQEPGCQMCHPDLAGGKYVHAAVSMGCEVCHTDVDASDIPHKFTSRIPKGLLAESPDLCFNCHDKGGFTAKAVVHMPVEAGMCTGCHNPHNSENEFLLIHEGNTLCLGCHAVVADSSHVISGHPLEDGEDPVRKGKTFGCISCHLPHSSDWTALLRYEAEDRFSLCAYCHPR